MNPASVWNRAYAGVAGPPAPKPLPGHIVLHVVADWANDNTWNNGREIYYDVTAHLEVDVEFSKVTIPGSTNTTYSPHAYNIQNPHNQITLRDLGGGCPQDRTGFTGIHELFKFRQVAGEGAPVIALEGDDRHLVFSLLGTWQWPGYQLGESVGGVDCAKTTTYPAVEYASIIPIDVDLNDLDVGQSTKAKNFLHWSIEVQRVDDSERKKEETIPSCCEGSGSIIGFENQSLGEVVNVAGTPFLLHYQSDRAVGRNLVNSVAVAYAQALGGWTLSAHHRYDPAANELYLGDGGYRDAADLGTVKSSAAGGFLIASLDTSVIYEFATNGSHLRTLHSLTGATLYTFSYDSKGLLIDIVDGNGNHTVIQRKANGSPTAIVGPYGQTTRLTVDANGYLASIAHPSGAVDKFTMTPTGLLTSYINARKKISKFSYDALGRLKNDTDAAGGVQTLTRSETVSAFTVTLRTAEGRTSQYQTTRGGSGGEGRAITDAAGLKRQGSRAADGAGATTLPDGTKTTHELEADPRFGQSAAINKNSSFTTPSGLKFAGTAARRVTLADPANPFSLSALTDTVTANGRVYSSAYNSASRSFEYKTPAGRVLQTSLDPQGRVVSESTTGLFPIANTYDARGRLASVSQGGSADVRTLQFNYDSAGYLERLTDPLGRSVSFARDAAGRVTKQTLPDGRTIGYGYDANGNLTVVTPPGRPAHGFTYSNVDQAASYVAPKLGRAASNTKYSYNRDRQLVSVSQPGGQRIALSYDAAGRAAAMKIKRGTFGFAYDANTGRLNNITAPGGIGLTYAYDGHLLTSSTLTGPVAGSVQRAYDNDFRVKELRVNNANAISFQFDQDGLLTNAGALTLLRDSQNGLLTGSTLGKVTDSFSYDGFGAVKAYTAKLNATDVLKTQYSYDKLGRIITRTEIIAGHSDTFEYTYDPAGRLAQVKKNAVIQTTYTYDRNGNLLTRTAAGVTATGSYDNQDRLTRYGIATYTYSPNGELKRKTEDTRNTDYTYDELGNLLSVALPGGKKIDYLVDGSNRRIGKKVNGALVQGFLYQGQLRPIAELDGSNNVVSRFVYATHVNVPDYIVKGGVAYRMITDHLGSPRLVVDAATGTVAQRLDYDAFGNVTTDTNPDFQPFGFAGGLFDQFTKFVRFGARDYDAETGRWTAKDLLAFSRKGSNLYAYVSNNPINQTDSSGLAPNDKTYGLPRDFWNWYHRQVKRPGDPDLSREEALEEFVEWERQGKPDPEGKKPNKGGDVCEAPADAPLPNPELESSPQPFGDPDAALKAAAATAGTAAAGLTLWEIGLWILGAATVASGP